MKILHISHLYPNSVDPVIGTHIKYFIEAVSKRTESTIIAPVPSDINIRDVENNVLHPKYESKNYDFPLDEKNFKKEFSSYEKSILNFIREKNINFDLIHSHFLFPDSIVAKKISDLYDINYVISVQGTWIIKELMKYPQINYLVGESVKNSSLLLSAHYNIIDQLRNEYPDKPIKYLKLPINLKDFSKANGNEIREEFNISKDKFVITYIGRFDPLKDPKTFIETSIILRKRKDLVFLIVGDDDPSYSLRKKLEKKVKNKQRNVIFTGFREDVEKILAISDLFVSLNTYDNIWTIAPLEAMASGVAVILTNVGYTSKFLKHKKNCYLIEPQNPKELSQAIIKLIENSKLRKKIAENGKILVEKSFSFNKIAEKAKKIYRNVQK